MDESLCAIGFVFSDYHALHGFVCFGASVCFLCVVQPAHIPCVVVLQLLIPLQVYTYVLQPLTSDSAGVRSAGAHERFASGDAAQQQQQHKKHKKQQHKQQQQQLAADDSSNTSPTTAVCHAQEETRGHLPNGIAAAVAAAFPAAAAAAAAGAVTAPGTVPHTQLTLPNN